LTEPGHDGVIEEDAMETTDRAHVDRRTLLRYGAAAAATVAVSPALPALAEPASARTTPDVLPAPKPIPGGLELPDGSRIHVFPPGPTGFTLPFSGGVLQGLDVEPSVITDYSGFTALAFHVGTATDGDGKAYNLETDIRVMDGRYVAADGSRRRGVFGFV
jgi:hypothetical protein